MRAKFYLILAKNIVIIVLLLVFPTMVSAEYILINENNTSVINNVSAEANSGGQNVSDNTEVTEGKSTVKTEIYTEINGEVVEDIKKEISGDDANLKVGSEVRADSNNVLVTTTIETQGNFDETVKEIDLNTKDFSSSQVTSTDKNNQTSDSNKAIGNGLVNFLQKLIEFFNKIFSIFN